MSEEQAQRMSVQIALARPRLPRFRHCLSPLRHFLAHSRFPQTVCPVPALGLDPVVKAVVKTVRVVGRRAARVLTACHFDTIVPDPVRELRSVGSMPPAPLHSTSYYAAAFPFPIGDSVALEDRDSINRVVVADSQGRLIPGGDCREMLVGSVARIGVVAAAVVQGWAHHQARESRLP